MNETNISDLINQGINATPNVTNIVPQVAEKTSDASSWITGMAIKKLVDSGVLLNPATIKLISIFFLCLFLYFETKITKKILKIVLIVLTLAIIGSIGWSFV